MSKEGQNGSVDTLIGDAYSQAHAGHGDLGLEFNNFAAYIIAIAEKHLGSNATDGMMINFIGNLRTDDLYITAACVQNSERAWCYFMSNYNKFINELARFLTTNNDAAQELSNSVLSNLLLPNRSGNSRMASYDGRSSLSTWLRVVVAHRAANERELKANHMEHFDSIPEIADETALQGVEDSLRSNQYDQIINSCFDTVCKGLSAKERLLLLWRYDEGLQLGQIARLIGVHQSTVARQLQRIQRQLREEAISLLVKKYHLSRQAIEECLTEILENPTYSLIESIRAAPRPSQNHGHAA